ncbi:MAG: methyltransferase domain-containing protein [Polyangiaceae bacterium]
MRRTDYESIAPRFDQNVVRYRIDVDAHLEALVGDRATPVRALDLGCGTGNYLVKQQAAFGERVSWTGMDPSEGMLAIARSKLPHTSFVIGRAEVMPFSDAAFDYVATNFAFHHFEDKERALDEIVRVSAPAAGLRIANIDPTRMPGWWGYRLFPETIEIDEARFWTTARITEALEARGYEVEVRVVVESSRVSARDVLEEARRRDVSQLAVLDDAAYERGLARVTELASASADARLRSEVAVATVRASRRAYGPVTP